MFIIRSISVYHTKVLQNYNVYKHSYSDDLTKLSQKQQILYDTHISTLGQPKLLSTIICDYNQPRTTYYLTKPVAKLGLVGN